MTLEESDKKYILNTYAKNYINFVKGNNAKLYDDTNKDYIDFTSGIGVTSVGHGNKDLAKTIFNQISNITHISNLYTIQPQIQLAKTIVELSKYDMACFFANSGAEANEGAIKIARKYGDKNNNKRYKIITLNNSFHGRTITTLKATGQDSMHQNSFAPYPDGFVYQKSIDDIYSCIDDKTIAVMLELVQGEGGVQPFLKDEIQKLSNFLKQNDILLIIDEVQTGCFRTGEFLASNLYEIEPDIITMAKGLGGGVPIGVVMTKHKDILQAGDHGSTFGGNYLSSIASLKVCEILRNIKDDSLLDNTIKYFDNKLQSLFKKNKNIFLDIVGVGLMRGLRVKDSDTLSKVVENGIQNGVLVLKAGRDTLRFLPPLTITNEEIDIGFKRLEDAICNI